MEEVSKFKKGDGGKSRPDLIPAAFLLMVGDVFAHGAKTYGEYNWESCDDPKRYLAAAFRHLLAYSSGEDTDPDSGLAHLGHCASSLAILWELEKRKKT